MSKTEKIEKKPRQRQQQRATYEDVRDSQERLRTILQELTKENRPLTDQERPTFTHLLSDSLLGQGNIMQNTPIQPTIPITEIIQYRWPTIYTFTNYILEQTTNTIHLERLGFEADYPIAYLWIKLKAYLEELFPIALQDAMRMSAEQIDMSQFVDLTEGRESGDMLHKGFPKEVSNKVE